MIQVITEWLWCLCVCVDSYVWCFMWLSVCFRHLCLSQAGSQTDFHRNYYLYRFVALKSIADRPSEEDRMSVCVCVCFCEWEQYKCKTALERGQQIKYRPVGRSLLRSSKSYPQIDWLSTVSMCDMAHKSFEGSFTSIACIALDIWTKIKNTETKNEKKTEGFYSHFNQFQQLSLRLFIICLGKFGELCWFGFLIWVNTQYNTTKLQIKKGKKWSNWLITFYCVKMCM